MQSAAEEVLFVWAFVVVADVNFRLWFIFALCMRFAPENFRFFESNKSKVGHEKRNVKINKLKINECQWKTCHTFC